MVGCGDEDMVVGDYYGAALILTNLLSGRGVVVISPGGLWKEIY